MSFPCFIAGAFAFLPASIILSVEQKKREEKLFISVLKGASIALAWPFSVPLFLFPMLRNRATTRIFRLVTDLENEEVELPWLEKKFLDNASFVSTEFIPSFYMLFLGLFVGFSIEPNTLHGFFSL
uniref:Transmembrane domain containing protein n=1 Tax=Marseillevirus sp. TaxID=2809551 RepID=A0AA96J0P4_9VIRU|nr:transmembrane domain containing protein [Marseillevirus sp.]